MRIETSDGIPIFCLPDCAICELSGEHPDSMIRCPALYYDNGWRCVPEKCNEYREEWEKNG